MSEIVLHEQTQSSLETGKMIIQWITGDKAVALIMPDGLAPRLCRSFPGKVAAPTVDDDADAGYINSDIWEYITTNTLYILKDNTNGAAVWQEIGAGGGAATQIVETSGPTTLDIGAIGDGEFLKRSGTNVVGGTPSGSGDMTKAVYDPGAVEADAFDCDNHADGAVNGPYTLAERSKLTGIEAGAQVNDVDSVNGQTGTVVLDADDIDDAATTNKFATAAELSKLGGIEAGADVTDAGNVGAAIQGAAEDATPADTDRFGQVSSGGTLAWTAWSTIKSLIQTALASVFVAITQAEGDRFLVTDKTTGAVEITDEVLYDSDNGRMQIQKSDWTGLRPLSAGAAMWPQFIGARARGTVAVPTAVQDDDILAEMKANPHDGTGFGDGGRVRLVANQTWDADSHGTRWEVWLVPDDSTTETLIATITADGVMNLISGGAYKVNGVEAALISAVQTLTNKRITKRPVTVTVAATPSINTDDGDIFRIGVTGDLLDLDITSMSTNLSGTPTHGQMAVFEFLDDGTGRAIAWGASFRNTGPSTTTASKLLKVLCMWDSADSKWDIMTTWEEE